MRGKEGIQDARNYLKVSNYVGELREALAREGRINTGLFPSQIKEEQVTDYLYWYSCAAFGDPNYAITVTVQFPTDEILFGEINRIEELEGFTEYSCGDYTIIGGKDMAKRIEGYYKPPTQDGSRYTISFAIVSVDTRTITYSELCIWENQIIHGTISSQLDLVYKCMNESSIKI